MKALKVAVIAAALVSASLPAHAATFLYTGALATYIVPADRWYQLTVAGAQGGSYDNHLGGFGAVITANLYLPANTVLTVLLGGQGAPGGGDTGSGGGGMSFVSYGMTPLIVAGGGGGAAWGYRGPGGGGQIGTDGGGLFGGTAGSGGTNASSGAGWYSDGAFSDPDAYHGAGGRSWPTFAGGVANNGEPPISQGAGPGGFGGGGGPGYSCGGGGGGYSGGAGGLQGAFPAACGSGSGGGSYITSEARNVIATAGQSLILISADQIPTLGAYDGFVSIEFASTVPEPSTWAIMILGFGFTGAMLRRRKAANNYQATIKI